MARWLTSLRHGSVMPEDEAIRSFVQLVDGTRNVDQLVADFKPVVSQVPGQNGASLAKSSWATWRRRRNWPCRRAEDINDFYGSPKSIAFMAF